MSAQSNPSPSQHQSPFEPAPTPVTDPAPEIPTTSQVDTIEDAKALDSKPPGAESASSDAGKKKYAVISDDQRKKLLMGVLTQGRQIKEVCQEVGINLSTAQGIIKTFLSEGRIGKKKTRSRWNPFIRTISNIIHPGNSVGPSYPAPGQPAPPIASLLTQSFPMTRGAPQQNPMMMPMSIGQPPQQMTTNPLFNYPFCTSPNAPMASTFKPVFPNMQPHAAGPVNPALLNPSMPSNHAILSLLMKGSNMNRQGGNMNHPPPSQLPAR